MRKRIQRKGEHFCDIITSKNQSPPFGLKFEGFNSSFFKFHIDNESLTLIKNGDTDLKEEGYFKIKQLKTKYDILNDLSIQIKKDKIGEITEYDLMSSGLYFPKEIKKITISLIVPETLIFLNITGKLRSAVEYFPIILDVDSFYPLLVKTRVLPGIHFNGIEKNLRENYLIMVEDRLREIWSSFNSLTQGKLGNRIYSPFNTNLSFENNQEEIKVNAHISYINENSDFED